MWIFEWDERKEKANRRKHRIGFNEAETVFYDPHSITIRDPDHSVDESRFIDIGTSDKNRLLIVVYTERSDRIRIISARKGTATERRRYETENS